MKNRFKTTSFWLGVSGAIVIILETISKMIGLKLYSKEVETIILAICSILVLMGIVTKKDVSDKKDSTPDELLKDIKDKNDLE